MYVKLCPSSHSRTGSKLGISPLMLAAMNGHTAAVKLLLDMGSDINAQIETNRNTALTLACFQGRQEVVSLLVDRKANIEHRAKVCLSDFYLLHKSNIRDDLYWLKILEMVIWLRDDHDTQLHSTIHSSNIL